MAEPSVRASIVEARTYLRPIAEDAGIFETPAQAAERIIGHQRWLWQRAKAGMLRRVDGTWDMLPLTDAEEAELQELKSLFLSRKVTFSGRTRWLGGTDIGRQIESTQFNPLPVDQAFITDRGVYSFADFQDGDTVNALTHTGRFMPAVVKDAGVRDMLTLRLRRGRTVYDQRSSVEHTWIKIDGERVEARDLKIGDRLWRTAPSNFFDWDFDAALPDEQAWWCYGFVFGDGTLTNGGKRSMVRLCGDKAKYLSRFVGAGFHHTYPPSCSNDPIVYSGGYVKTLPTGDEDARLIAAFLRGYLAADGNKAVRHGRESVIGLTTSDPAAADFVRTWLPVFGVYILRDEPDVRETNYGKVNGTSFSFTVGGQQSWTVEAISAAPREHCWCLTVDEDHSFVLPNGVVTGNCCFLEMRSIHDVVDMLWLLLQGCGVGFRPVVGSLNGFTNPMEIEVIRSTRSKDEKGSENNLELYDRATGTWTIRVGDSAVAWAKSIGKIMAGKYPAKKLVLDFSEIRGAGGRLRNYGWISSGDEQISSSYVKIAKIMNARAGELLTRIDLLDIANLLGTILSSRRSAEIALLAYGEPEWEAFAKAKKDHWTNGNDHRAASNNSVMFYSKPTKYQLKRLFKTMEECGGSEPGFINAVAAQERAPWFKGVNPCAEILLADRGFCNLVETVLSRFNGDEEGLTRAHYLVARANYRQTCVSLVDPVLQRGWHENQEFLRLCGVGVTGVVGWEHADEPYAWADLRIAAWEGAHSMADELNMPRSKAVTTIKPSGTQSKALGTAAYGEVSEGLHKPLGRYIFNNIRFSAHDPIVEKLRASNYFSWQDPYDPTGVLVRIPIEFKDVPFEEVNGVPVNLESAVSQLARYKLVMDNYVDHNASITVSYSPDEVPEIVDWLIANWDSYVGVSFLYRNDPTKTAADLGYPYLPQEVVSRDVYEAYVATLLPVNLSDNGSVDMLEGTECAGGSCPVR